MNIPKSIKISAAVFFTVILLALAAVTLYQKCSAEVIPLSVKVNGAEFDIGSVKCSEIPQINGCIKRSDKGKSYLFKSYDSAADLESCLRSCIPDDVSGSIKLEICDNEYLRLSYACDSSETGSTLNVTAYKYINSLDTAAKELTFNNFSKEGYAVEKPSQAGEASGDLTKFTEYRREYALEKAEQSENAIRIAYTETSVSNGSIQTSVQSGHCMVFIKDNVLYTVSGYDEEPCDKISEKTL